MAALALGSIKDSLQHTLNGLNPVPGGQELAAAPGTAGTSLMYLLTDDGGFAQFLSEVAAHANTRILAAPRIVTLANQQATIFVGTERPTIAPR